MWKDILLTIISVTVPLIVTYSLNILSKYLSVKTQNEKIDGVLKRTSDIINAVVAETTQTFVDELKKTGEWSNDNALNAFNLSKAKALELIDISARNTIQDYAGDFNAWLAAKIESAVQKQ